LLPEQTIKHPLVDLIVIGEGEKTFSEVVKAYISGDDLAEIPGTCIQKNNGEIVFGPKREFIDMDELPLPAYDLIDVKKYHGIEYQFDYQSSRGCPFRCGFCYNVTFCGRRWRKKSPDKVTEELTFLHNKYNVKNFGFVDDEFFIHLKRVEAIFDRILEGNKKFGIIASCRLDIIHRASPILFEKMKKAGMTQMFFGAESGSEKMLKEIQKDITQKDIITGAKCVAEAGIRPILSFMSGFPGETTEELKNTFDVILELWGGVTCF
ncbi:MAG: radical SAM protein, partial [Candidatus Electrothrix sp. ATG2]|nr:radical SAM protein [Candidatus Electrothrix sp. ATG2]